MLVETLFNILIIVLIAGGAFMVFKGSVKGPTKIVIMVVIFILVVYLITQSSMFKRESHLNKSIKDAKSMKVIPYDKLKPYENNYTYCAWMYVNDWNYKYGQKKRILTRLSAKPSDESGLVGYNPDIYLSELQNDLIIAIQCHDPETQGTINHECMIENVNLQKWVCVIIVLNTRSLDVYINGKLARTCVLPGVPLINNSSDLYLAAGDDISPDAVCGKPPSDKNLCGFGGFLGNIKFYPSVKNPQQVWDIYRQGPGDSILGNLLNKYQMKFIFSEDGEEKSEFNIL